MKIMEKLVDLAQRIDKIKNRLLRTVVRLSFLLILVGLLPYGSIFIFAMLFGLVLNFPLSIVLGTIVTAIIAIYIAEGGK